MNDAHSSSNDPSPWQSLLRILRGRRSRRFGRGMRMTSGPMAYESRDDGLPLTEEEEALLTYAACGVTGHALADLVYERGEGGTIMGGLLGRTIPSGDALHTCSLIVINETACYYIKRPSDYEAEEIPTLVELAAAGEYVDLYRRSRVKIRDGRANPPVEPFFNLNCNRWSLYDPAATYFLPVEDFTGMYINALLEILNEHNGIFIVDERAGFRPAGLKRFAQSRGGHLVDDTHAEHTITIQQLETLVTEFVTAEASMMIQNIGLMTQALGLGGFPHWAAHYYGWFETLRFDMIRMDASRFLGMNWLRRTIARLLGRDLSVPYVTGLEVDGRQLLKPLCPPNYPTMESAVREVVDRKWGEEGIFRGGAADSAWAEPDHIRDEAPPESAAAVEATIAYTSYVYERYGRFPAYQMPLHTLLGFQANHVDIDFYDRFYKPEALTPLQRDHLRNWH